MKRAFLIFALLVASVTASWGQPHGLRLLYGSGVAGEIRPCG